MSVKQISHKMKRREYYYVSRCRWDFENSLYLTSIIIHILTQFAHIYRYLEWSSNQGTNNLFRMKILQAGNHEIGPVRQSHFLEEKRWPPNEFKENQYWKEKRVSLSNISSNKNSQSLFQQNNFVQQPKWRWRYNSLEPKFETPFRLEVNFLQI